MRQEPYVLLLKERKWICSRICGSQTLEGLNRWSGVEHKPFDDASSQICRVNDDFLEMMFIQKKIRLGKGLKCMGLSHIIHR